MKSIIFSLVCCFACIAGQELISVALVYRHGDRTPSDFYENDPYSNITLWPEGIEQLTNEGKMRQYNLGQWLRNRYSKWLPEKYNPKDILVMSDDVDRTIMSALANLAGLYPPQNDQKWSDLNWMPIPIHNRPTIEDSVIALDKPCDKYDKLFKKLLKNDHFQQVDEDYKEIYEYLTENSGTKTKTLKKAKKLYTTLAIEAQRNITLPAWTQQVFPEPLKTMTGLSLQSYVYTDKLIRLRIGPFYHELIGNFRKATEGVTKVKMWQFSGHEKNVVAVLAGLKALKPHVPQFASTVIFELKRNNGEYYIEVYYKHGDELERIQVGGCDLECPFDDFVQVMEEVTIDPSTWDKECAD
ncbi:testicular acid phosphatase homolog [Aethina tumida]|uniref:testicular acid phosphatase homolog n=1 Tax=Aethina tumida TaxID=116153 RepID=UPI00096B01BA|nr:testicular acid phosphatase homolog [Aethina tumida]